VTTPGRRFNLGPSASPFAPERSPTMPSTVDPRGGSPMSGRPDQTAHLADRSTLEHDAKRVVDAGAERGVVIRVLGSIGVSIHCPGAQSLIPAFGRTYADLDFAAYRRDARAVSSLLGDLGYVEDREVSISSEGRRGLFDDRRGETHVDVFYDRLEFCHPIPLAGRLESDRPTIPLAELLLSKLQIVRINEKDVIDAVLLLLEHELDEGTPDTIDTIELAVVTRLCGGDWGLWRTVSGNLDKVRTLAGTYPQLSDEHRARVELQVARLSSALEAEPKTFGWRARARIGERKQWWTDVDEVR
jgi:hypothetical protein